MRKGKLIVIEGTDGSGKGTQLKLLLDYFKRKKTKHTYFDFPQYKKTFFGDFVARFLNGEFGHFSRINPYLSMFPYAADRWQVKDKLWSALDQGKIIICNRYTPSVLYQAAKVKPSKKKEFLKWAYDLEFKIFGIPKPDLIIFLYVPTDLAQTLIEKRYKKDYLKNRKKDQYEKNVDYLKKVEKLYLIESLKNKHWVKIDCVENGKILPIETIHQKIIDVLKKTILKFDK